MYVKIRSSYRFSSVLQKSITPLIKKYIIIVVVYQLVYALKIAARLFEDFRQPPFRVLTFHVYTEYTKEEVLAPIIPHTQRPLMFFLFLSEFYLTI